MSNFDNSDEAKEGGGAPAQQLFDALELEHVIGYSGQHKQTLRCHPKAPNVCVFGLGSNVLIQDLCDAHGQKFLYGHDEQISAVAVSECGTLIASGQLGTTASATREAPVIVWDYSNRFDVFSLHGITGGVSNVAFSSDSHFLAATGEDHSIVLWDLETGETVASKKHAALTTTLQWGAITAGASSRPDYCLLATQGAKVLCYTLKYSVASMQYLLSVEDMRVPPGLLREYTASCLTLNGRTLVLGTSVGDVNYYDVEARLYHGGLAVCSGGIACVECVNGAILVGGGDGSLKVLDVGLKHIQAEIRLSGSVNSISAECDSTRLLVGTNHGKIYRLDGAGDRGGGNETANSTNSNSNAWQDLRVMSMIQGETSEVVAVAFKPSCSVRFATLTRTGVVRIWDLADYNLVSTSRSGTWREDEGTCLVYDDGEDQVVTGWTGGSVRAFAASGEGELLWEIHHAHKKGISAVCATPMYYATGGSVGGVRLWSRGSRTQLFEFQDHFSKRVIELVADRFQEHLLHSCGVDRSVYTYDLKKEKRVVSHHVTGGGTFVSMTQRLDSEHELVTASTDGSLLTWDYDVPEPVASVVDEGTEKFTCVRVSPKTGRFLAACNTQQLVKLWDLHTGRVVSVGRAHTSAVNQLAWSPDERQLVSVGQDMGIAVWNFYAELVDADA